MKTVIDNSSIRANIGINSTAIPLALNSERKEEMNSPRTKFEIAYRTIRLLASGNGNWANKVEQSIFLESKWVLWDGENGYTLSLWIDNAFVAEVGNDSAAKAARKAFVSRKLSELPRLSLNQRADTSYDYD